MTISPPTQPKLNAWDTLIQNPIPNITIDYPRNDAKGEPICKITLRTLTQGDHIKIQEQATFECDRSFKKDDKLIDHSSQVYIERYKNIQAKFFLFKCCLDPDNNDKPFFPTTDSVDGFPPDEVAFLMARYRFYQNEAGPIINTMDMDTFQMWKERIIKDAESSADFLELCSPLTLARFIIFLARARSIGQTDNSSAITPEESSTTEYETNQQNQLPEQAP